MNVLFYQLLKILYEHFYTPQSGVLDTSIQVKEREKRKKKKDCWETFLFDVFLLTKYFRCLKKEKRTVSWISSLFVFDRRIFKFCYILNTPLCWNVLIVFSSSIELISFAYILYFDLIPLSLILANTSYCLPKQYKRIWKYIYSECHLT